jgi:predicted phage-related endonuclease
MPATERTAFLEERRTGIGGSDIASIFNVGYGCRRRLWYDKRGVEPDFLREETKAMRLGQLMEPWFADEYREATGRMVEPRFFQFRHQDHRELTVHVDRVVFKDLVKRGEFYDSVHINTPDRDNPGVLEIKSTGRAAFYKYKREGLPDDYILQLQHGMLVTDATWGSFAIGSRDSGDLLWWDVDADMVIHQRILEEGPAFWAIVQNGPIPDALEPEDRRCQRCEYRVTCHGAAFVPQDEPSDYELDASLAPLAREYVERRELKAQAEELLDETKNELLVKLGKRRVVAEGIKLSASSFVKKEYTVKAHAETRLNVYAPGGVKLIAPPLKRTGKDDLAF